MSFFERTFLANIAKALINPATEEKQDDTITALGLVATEDKQPDPISDGDAVTTQKGNVILGLDAIFGGFKYLNLDANGRYLPNIEPEHTRIHEGVAFEHTDELVAANDGVVEYLFSVPAGCYPHFRSWSFTVTNSPGSVSLYEGPTVTDNGDLITPVNLNRLSGNVNGMLMYENPTVTADGTRMQVDHITGGKLSGGSSDKYIQEFDLMPSTLYLLRYINRSGVVSDVNPHIFWYEV
jgi:hypothetical protein